MKFYHFALFGAIAGIFIYFKFYKGSKIKKVADAVVETAKSETNEKTAPLKAA